MVAIGMCAKMSIMGERIYKKTRKHVLPFIFFIYLFICLSVKKYFYNPIYAMFDLG